MVAVRSASAVMSRALLAAALVAALGVAAGTGCSRTANKKPAEKLKTEVPKRPFEELRVFTEPNEQSFYEPNAKDDRRIVLTAKPGHWTGVLVQGQANLFDFDGTLQTTAEDSQQRPVDLENTPYWLSTRRPITLPKEQRKIVETLFFPPPPAPRAGVKGSTWIANRLEGRTGAAPIERVPEIVQHMPSFQYYFVVLASQPDRYGYLNDMSWVRPPIGAMPTNIADGYYYRVLFPPVDKPLALPSESLCWTSTALVVWDDVLPSALSPEQQQAIVDWLHWGGRLIVSGPDSLDKLRGSLLAEYLPAAGDKSGTIDPAKLAELHSSWTLDGDKSESLAGKNGWTGIELVTTDQAELVANTGGLVARRRVGRGMVVVTAFHLGEKALTQWPSFDGFFHACLLDRPARKFETWERGFNFVGETAADIYDSRINTGLRFLTRDEMDPKVLPLRPSQQFNVDPNNLANSQFFASGHPLDLVDQLKAQPGTAGWNDASWISTAARLTLQDAAGISVPRRQFVFKMIGLYLLVIVPINWLVFRMVGRVEWAWLAVPVVALAWGVLVVWLAQLDIGFARAQTQVDVVEVHNAYPRAHLTRYTALYSSLSSEYDLDLGASPAVALPFSTGSRRLAGQGSSGVTLTSLGQRSLTGYTVASNSTGMVHSEQMLDLGGVLEWKASTPGTFVLTNSTELTLSGAALLHRDADGTTTTKGEYAWLGTVEPGDTVTPKFEPWSQEALAARRDAEPISQPVESGSGELNLRRLFECAEDLAVLVPGETRLVAWCDKTLGEFDVRPSTARSRAATLVVVHLTYGPPPAASRDINLRPLNPLRLRSN